MEPSSSEDSLESGRNGMPNGSNAIICNESNVVKNESVESLDIAMDSDTESVAPAVLYSERTWTESDHAQEQEKAQHKGQEFSERDPGMDKVNRAADEICKEF